MEVAISGFAAVEIALQLANGFAKLHDFWVTIQEAPEDIADMVSELRCLSDLLSEIATQQYTGRGILSAMERCGRKVKILHGIVQEFEPNFTSHLRRVRFWNKLKAARKKQKLKEFRESLLETKTTLILALTPKWLVKFISRTAIGNVRDALDTREPRVSAPSQSTSDSESPPSYSEAKPTVLERADDGTISSVPDVQDPIRNLIESALLAATRDSFDGTSFAKLMNDMMQHASSVQSPERSYHTTRPVQPHCSTSDKPTSQTPIADQVETASALLRQQGGSPKVYHQISGTETPFGTIWCRTSTVKTNGRSKSPKGIHLVTSYVYYPSWWLSKLGVKTGMEANLSSSPKGWQFCLNPVRAVPDDSLIFDFCKTGNIEAVQHMIARGVASVQDTNSKGWTPLHFAADAANVELCEFLISERADKRALAYEGPSENTLSSVTIFAEKVQCLSAQRKIAMLRLFLDTLDLSEPSDDGWTVIGSLVKAQSREDSSLASNSISWFLQQFSTDKMVKFGAKTLWHGLQHAVRAFIQLTQEDMVLQELNDLGVNSIKSSIRRSQVVSLARWTALRVAGRRLLPMLNIAGAILHCPGFDWVGDGPQPNAALAEKQLPFIFSTWTSTLADSIESVQELTAVELQAILEQAGWTSAFFQGLDSKLFDERPQSQQRCSAKPRCSACGDDYTFLGAGVVEPSWIAFAECTKSKHRFDCLCSNFPWSEVVSKIDHIRQSHQSMREEDDDKKPGEIQQQLGLSRAHTSQLDDGDDANVDTEDEDPFYDTLPEQLREGEQTKEDEESLIIQALETLNKTDPFSSIALDLYRTQGQAWLGSYQPAESLCGTCFLRRERYIDEKGDPGNDMVKPPERFVMII
ncbi:hypothetical protein EPUS_08522 [Endocarpon pusillum Z07020]|uniref:Uncharacterized protein n=1 Tax=Endocarpon pusillum (strain Z07020 / HMAS-L-300199) TaxID=1263415 RepID=U1GSK5_ENDPU|nr:uncharacterized protein EPUS_08522 [Endocarpon pusillum Z07020]ERF74981.1 hypothetical protein EPUS_08522 [Endocarpon pusillum Z07020]